ncbi:ATP-binding protein [Microbacterium sp. SORGH_AS_0421]|uniref:HD domain-containing protein n=1 Tax=Microbacterium sp. SORGH_AS_0421 TaxID=3041768 RepID=UPI0027941912|nr:ATP-binding protein [Microbacterium sp. SORGH_AS_0421]MDQ1178471.1 hypothetical protein [Microbacterium sp. SORGH_AS_0421]
MPVVDFEETALWKRTLGLEGDGVPSQVSTLRAAYLQFREHVEPVAQEISLSVPGYTDHGISHCDSLWRTASLLLGEDFPLNPAEAFVLGGSFLVHDLGMGASAYPGGLLELVESVEFSDIAAAAFADEYDTIVAAAKKDLSANPTWNGLSDRRAKDLLTALLRRRHAAQAVEVVSNSWELSNGQSMYLLADTTLRLSYGDCIGQVGRSHWLDVAELQSELPPQLGAIPGFPADWTVDPVKIACILRLADAINVDASRAHPLHTPHRLPQAESLTHWLAQEKLLSADIRNHRVYFTSTGAFNIELADAWWLTYDTVRMIDSELRRVDNLCGDLDIPRFRAHAAAGAESPQRFARFVRPVGWEPIDARPFIGDQNLVMKRLGGASLYGKYRQAEVSLREILANAMDATRALDSAFGGDAVKPILVTLERGDEFDKLTVRDYGIGILSNQMASTLCNFGTSGWRSEAAQEAIPGLVSSGFRPTGKFGIGFFAAFMASDRVRVISRHVEESKKETSVLDFPDALNERPLLRPASRQEQLLEPGTSVELVLKVRVDEEEGLFDVEGGEDFPTTRQFVRYLRRLALTSNVDIDAHVVGHGPRERVVTAGQWGTADGTWLMDAMNASLDLDEPSYLRFREEFANSLTPLYDDDGELKARLSLSAPPPSIQSAIGFSAQRTYIGGVDAREDSEPFSGVVEGSPASAARQDARLEVSDDELKRWFVDQVESLEDGSISPSRRVVLRFIALRMGVELPHLEVGSVSDKGLVADHGLDDWLSRRRRFAILQGRAISIPSDGKVVTLFDADGEADLLYLSENCVAVEDDFFGSSKWNVRAMDQEITNASGTITPSSVRWWGHVHRSPIAHVIRRAAVVWDVPLASLVERVFYVFARDAEEFEPELLTLRDVHGEGRAVGGWVVDLDAASL